MDLRLYLSTVSQRRIWQAVVETQAFLLRLQMEMSAHIHPLAVFTVRNNLWKPRARKISGLLGLFDMLDMLNTFTLPFPLSFY
jgi:hypothetical protein